MTTLTCVGCAFQGQEQAGKCSVCDVTDRSAIAGPRPVSNRSNHAGFADGIPANKNCKVCLFVDADYQSVCFDCQNPNDNRRDEYGDLPETAEQRREAFEIDEILHDDDDRPICPHEQTANDSCEGCPHSDHPDCPGQQAIAETPTLTDADLQAAAEAIAADKARDAADVGSVHDQWDRQRAEAESAESCIVDCPIPDCRDCPDRPTALKPRWSKTCLACIDKARDAADVEQADREYADRHRGP